MDTRSLEVGIGILIAMRGLAIMLDPDSMVIEIYAGFRQVMDSGLWGVVCLVAGVFQIAGVVINGQWQRSPFLRFAGAAIGAVFYSMLTSVFVGAGGDATIVIFLYAPLATMEIWVAVNILTKR